MNVAIHFPLGLSVVCSSKNRSEMTLATLWFCLFASLSVFAEGNPTLGEVYGGAGGHGAVYGGAGGHGASGVAAGASLGGAGKHGAHGHVHSSRGGEGAGNAHGSDHRFNQLFRGEKDARHEHSDRKRKLEGRQQHRVAGDSFRDKGKSDDGFHKVYHKEEYSKNKKFFDTDRDHQVRNHYDDFGRFYDDVDARAHVDVADGEAEVKVGGQRGQAYGDQFYERGEGEFGTKDFGKRHGAHGKRYGAQHGYAGGHRAQHGYGGDRFY